MTWRGGGPRAIGDECTDARWFAIEVALGSFRFSPRTTNERTTMSHHTDRRPTTNDAHKVLEVDRDADHAKAHLGVVRRGRAVVARAHLTVTRGCTPQDDARRVAPATER